jgi:hypothetical protein
VKGPKDDVLAGLRGIPTVSSAEYVDETEPGCPGFRLSSGSDPREEIFETVSRRRWPMMELRREAASLDEVFHALTGGAPDSAPAVPENTASSEREGDRA